MSFILLLLRSFPFWATPMAISFVGSAIMFIKKGNKPLALYCGGIGLLLGVGVVLYVAFDGYSTVILFIYDNVVQ